MLDLITGPIIVTKFCGSTDTRESRILATHKRDSVTIWRRYHNYDHSKNSDSNHLAAAEKLLASWPYENSLKIVGCGQDASNYYFLCSTVTL